MQDTVTNIKTNETDNMTVDEMLDLIRTRRERWNEAQQILIEAGYSDIAEAMNARQGR